MGVSPTETTRPTGTVTFLFTDIEGSTERWESDRDLMAGAVSQHDSILRSAIETYNGYVFATGGDSFSAAFWDPLEAVNAATTAQAGLSDADWSGTESLNVRMGLNTGNTSERDGDYFGPPVNRAARIMSHAGGDEILMSDVTASLVRRRIDAGHVLEDLGEVSLKGVETPERIFRLADAGAVVSSPKRRWPLVAGVVVGVAAVAAVLGLFVIDGAPDPTTSTTIADSTTTSASVASPEPWRISLGSSDVAPAATSGVVVGAKAPTLLAFVDAGSGSIDSEPGTITPITSPPVALDGVIYLSAETLLFAFDAQTGGQPWGAPAFTPDNRRLTPPAVQQGLVVVGHANVVTAYEASTGEVRWETATVVLTTIELPPAIAGDSVFVVDQSGELYSLSLVDGSRRWTGVAAAAPGQPTPDAYIDIQAIERSFGSGLDRRTEVLVLTTDDAKFLVARDGDDGEILWHDPNLAVDTPAAVGTAHLYVVDARGDLRVIDLSGNVLGVSHTVGTTTAAPVYDASRQRVIVVALDGDLFVFDDRRGFEGDALWCHSLGVGVSLRPAVDETGRVFVVSEDGELIAVQIPSDASGSTCS